MATFGTLLASIQRNLGNRTDSDFSSVAMQAMNDLQTRLARAHRFKELEASLTFNTVDGTGTYSESTIGFTRLRKEFSVKVTDGTNKYDLEYYVFDRWLREIDPIVPQATENRPFCYTKWGTSWLLWYVPDAVYVVTVYYYQWPAVITSNSDVPTLTNIDDILISGTTFYTALSLEEMEIAQVWWPIFSNDLKLHGIEDKSVFNFRPGESNIAQRNWAQGDDHANPWIRNSR